MHHKSFTDSFLPSPLSPAGLTTKTPPTSMRRASPSRSVPSSLSTPRRPSAPSCPTRPPRAATRQRSCASSTRCRRVTRTRSLPPSTGSPATTSSSTPPSRTSRPRSCSPTSASSSHTCVSPRWPRRRPPLGSKLSRRGQVFACLRAKHWLHARVGPAGCWMICLQAVGWVVIPKFVSQTTGRAIYTKLCLAVQILRIYFKQSTPFGDSKHPATCHGRADVGRSAAETAAGVSDIQVYLCKVSHAAMRQCCGCWPDCLISQDPSRCECTGG